MILLAACLGATTAIGLCLVGVNLRTSSSRNPIAQFRRRLRIINRARLFRGAIAAIVFGLATRWPVAFAAGWLVGYFADVLLAGSRQGKNAVSRSEAIASWTEMLRDTLATGQGMQAVIRETAVNAPMEIRTNVQALAEHLESERAEVCLMRFADELANPTCDLVVVALREALQGSVSNLGDLLSTLAKTARAEASMRMRVESQRAKSRSVVRSIVVCTVGIALLLGVLNKGFLAPYQTAGGQVALGVIFAIFGAGMWWMARLSRFDTPERFALSNQGSQS